MADIWIGLDLGKLTDPTAAAVIRRSLGIKANGRLEKTSRGDSLYRFDVMAIRRYPLRTPYTGIVEHIVHQSQRHELQPRPRLVIDATGVGNPVVEMFRSAHREQFDIEVYAITITGGRSSSIVRRHEWHVAKIQLVGAIREALESRRLKVPPGLEHARLLKRELLDYRVKVTAAANETFSARDGAHDDLVLAVALPIWLAHQRHTQMDWRNDRLSVHEAAALAAERRAIERGEDVAAEEEREAKLAQQRELDRLAQEDPWNERWGWH
jgi:hypothetical protein